MARARAVLLSWFMHPNLKRDAQKTEEAGLTAETQLGATVTKPDAADKGGTASASEAQGEKKGEPAKRPRQDSLDRERASGEGMTAPPSNR